MRPNRSADPAPQVHRAYHKWVSPHLGRPMELLVFGHSGARVVVFPTRCGRFFDYENFGMVEGLREHLERGWLQLFCVDSVDEEGLYAQGRSSAERLARHVAYERYLLEEVLPFTRQRNPTPLLIAHGCSLGAFHAIDLAVRHPASFVKVVALSGRYDLTVPIGDFPALLDANQEPMLTLAHTPTEHVTLCEGGDLQALRRLEIVLVVGESDPFLPSNLALDARLRSVGAEPELHVWSGRAHSPQRWREMVRLYL